MKYRTPHFNLYCYPSFIRPLLKPLLDGYNNLKPYKPLFYNKPNNKFNELISEYIYVQLLDYLYKQRLFFVPYTSVNDQFWNPLKRQQLLLVQKLIIKCYSFFILMLIKYNINQDEKNTL